MKPTAAIKEPSFFQHIFKEKQNQRLFLIAFAANIILFFIFKMLCPDAYFLSDSNSYVLAAKEAKEVMYRPYGYPRFMQIVQYFSTDLNFLVWVQFLFLFIAGQFAFFSVDYLYRFRNAVIKKISWFFVTFNPVLFFLANFVLSDGIFTAFTAVYITLLLWVVKRPNWWVIILQAIILYWAFNIRYTALYFPVLTILAFLLSTKATILYKAAGIAASLILVFGAYTHIKSQVNEATGVDIFSGFSGWQMANNVLVLYPHIDTKSDDFETPEVKLLDSISHIYVDSLSPVYAQQLKSGHITTGFLWDQKSPLKLFMFNYMTAYRQQYFESWYQVSETYNEFGTAIIKKHPGAFLQYYLLPNATLFFLPVAEDMGNDEAKVMELPQGTIDWFGLSSGKLSNGLPNAQSYIANYSIFLKLIIAISNILLPLIYLLKRKKTVAKTEENDTKSVIFWWLMIGCNMAFSIFAALIVLRYECLWLIIGFGFPMIMLDRLVTKSKTTQS